MRRMPILLKRLTKGPMNKGKIIVGIIGTHKGVGVTHFSFMLASYLSDWIGQKTAYLECNPHNDLQSLEFTFGARRRPNSYFVHPYLNIVFYKNVKLQDITEIVNDSYECIILDLGTDINKNKVEFLRCDKKIVVSNLSPWKKSEFEKFVNATAHMKHREQWTYVFPFVEYNKIKEATREIQGDFFSVPYEPNPFSISSETIRFFQKFI